MRLICYALALALVPAGFADTITLRSGRVIHGTYLGGSPRQVRVEVGDQIRNLDISDIVRIEFGGGGAGPRSEMAPPPAAPEPPERHEAYAPPPPPPPAPAPDPAPPREASAPPPPAAPVPYTDAGGIVLPVGTNLLVRTIDGIDSQTARPGQTFAASLDQPVLDANGQELIPRGADAVLKLVDSTDSGTFTGRASLTLSLQSVRVNGQMVSINTKGISKVSDSRGKQTAERGGVGAVAGAALGAIFGGGKGAAQGAAVGAAAGAGSQVITKGQRVRIPSETRLTFLLDTPVRL